MPARAEPIAQRVEQPRVANPSVVRTDRTIDHVTSADTLRSSSVCHRAERRILATSQFPYHIEHGCAVIRFRAGSGYLRAEILLHGRIGIEPSGPGGTQ